MKKALILTAQGVQDEEFIYPYHRLIEEGYDLKVVFVPTEKYKKQVGKYGIPFKSDMSIENADIDELLNNDLLIIPGGWQAPEIMRMNNKVLDLVRKFKENNKIIAAVCHGPQVLISANILKGVNATGFSGIKDDLINAGANYIDAPFVTDNNIITSPHYKDLGPWMKEVLRVHYEKNDKGN